MALCCIWEKLPLCVAEISSTGVEAPMKVGSSAPAPGDPPPDTVTMFVTCGSALPATSTLTMMGG